jgi:hypothetical protein
MIGETAIGSEIPMEEERMKLNILMVALILFVATALSVSAQSAKPATLTVESQTEAEGIVNMDGQQFCSLPNHKTCGGSVPPGTHDFVIVFHDNDDPPDRKYTITTSGTFRAGEHRTVSVDTDGATWK